MILIDPKKFFENTISGTIPVKLFLIELVKMQTWVHGTPLPMTGLVTDELMAARPSLVRPGLVLGPSVPNGKSSYGSNSLKYQFYIFGELLFNDTRILH